MKQNTFIILDTVLYLMIIGGVLSYHLLDVSEVAMSNGYNEKVLLTNGFWSLPAIKLYHVGMWGGWIVIVLLGFIARLCLLQLVECEKCKSVGNC